MKAAGKISRSKRERGTSLVEYCLLCALIAISSTSVYLNFIDQIWTPFLTVSYYMEGGGSKGTER